MTLVQIVNALLVLGLPFLIALCYIVAQFQIQRMPMHQRAALEQFARMAVRYVEHQQVTTDKKTIATAYATDMFRLSGLPTPHKDVLEVAIGAALHEISKNG